MKVISMTWNSFLDMGGYAFFVWTSYAVFIVVLLASFSLPLIKRRTLVRDLREQWAVEARRRESQ